VLRRQGRGAEADEVLLRCLARFRALGDLRYQAVVLAEIGFLAEARGDFAVARADFEETQALSERAGDVFFAAGALWVLGWLALHEGEYAVARAWFEQSLSRRAGADFGNAGPHLGLLAVALADGDLAAAERSLLVIEAEAEAAPRDQAAGLLARSHWGAGHVALARDDLATATARFGQGLRAISGHGFIASAPASIASTRTRYLLEGLACVAARRGEVERALRLAAAAESVHPATLQLRELPFGFLLSRYLDPLRKGLDEEGQRQAEAAFAEGQAMTVEQAIAYALEGVGAADG
jgi:hypothetical protein